VQTQFPELFSIKDRAECRRLLIELVDENLAQLQELIDEFERNADETAASSTNELKCDGSPEAHRLLNYIRLSRRGLKQGIVSSKTYIKELKNDRDQTPPRTREDAGWTPRRRRGNREEMPEDVDLSWAYEASAASENDQINPRAQRR